MKRWPLLAATLLGLALWSLASLLTTRREPWDGSLYWVLVYPASLVACAALAYRAPQQPVLMSLVLFESQFLAQGVRAGDPGNLWPLGMVLFAVIAVPGIIAATVAARRSPYRTSKPLAPES